MEEVLYYSELFDIYKDLLTEKQMATFRDYYFENLTIEEIATNFDISKNAVSKSLKQIKLLLDDYEKSLRVKKYMDSLKEEFQAEEDILIRIQKYDNIIVSEY
ncbi:MAG: hypothetical protein HFG33_03300 [Bacilli bacterium]|nr:hypothetical protein [Bacilli bacterium]